MVKTVAEDNTPELNCWGDWLDSLVTLWLSDEAKNKRLAAERAKLLQRLEEINRQLGELDG